MDEGRAHPHVGNPVARARGSRSASRSAVATIGVVYAIIAIPFYVLAQSDRNGLDRPFFRNGLIHWGIPIGVVLGVACGALVGVWYARGGRLPTDRTPE